VPIRQRANDTKPVLRDTLLPTIQKIIRFLLVFIGVAIVVIGSLLLIQAHEERNEIFWSRVNRVQSDIMELQAACESYRKEYGDYPEDLDELLRASGSGSDTISTIRIHNNPWGTPYYYSLDQGAAGESVRIWTVVDPDTRSRLGLSQLSNTTDWHKFLKPR
jgi:hypothetical protein